jgi:hypothetical protein
MKQVIYNTILLFLFAMLLAYIGFAFSLPGAEADQLAGHLSSVFKIDRLTLQLAIDNVLHAYWVRRAMLFGFPWVCAILIFLFSKHLHRT